MVVEVMQGAAWAGLLRGKRPGGGDYPERCASYNATAPIEASSGGNKRHRLNQRGNRQLNWAIRALERQLSNVIHPTMVADARRLEQ